MKSSLDIYTILSTPDDMVDEHDDPEAACEALNVILHGVYDQADDDIELETLEKILQHCWEFWHREQQLTDIDDNDLLDWVDQLLATWDDSALEYD